MFDVGNELVVTNGLDWVVGDFKLARHQVCNDAQVFVWFFDAANAYRFRAMRFEIFGKRREERMAQSVLDASGAPTLAGFELCCLETHGG